VYLRETFAGSLAHVEIDLWPLPDGITREHWIVRDLPLGPFLKKILNSWQRGEKMPPPFRLRKRLAPELLAYLACLPDKELTQVFDKMRQEGMLPVQKVLNRRTWPPEIPWETARWCLLEWEHPHGPVAAKG